MSPFAHADGHDAPRLVDEFVPRVAAVIDDVVVGFEYSVGQRVVAHELPDVFGVKLGTFGRQRTRVMLGGATRRPDMSTRSMACAPGATWAAISARCKFIAATLQRGRMSKNLQGNKEMV